MTDEETIEAGSGSIQTRDAAAYHAGASLVLTARTDRHRPWRLLLVGDGIDRLSAGACEELTRILDLFPAVSHLVVQTTSGDCRVSRDFPSGFTAEVDQRLADIFRDNPAVTGIVFPATSSRPDHTATPDDPHWSPEGKASADILAALTHGGIGADEAAGQLVHVHRPNFA